MSRFSFSLRLFLAFFGSGLPCHLGAQTPAAPSAHQSGGATLNLPETLIRGRSTRSEESLGQEYDAPADAPAELRKQATDLQMQHTSRLNAQEAVAKEIDRTDLGNVKQTDQIKSQIKQLEKEARQFETKESIYLIEKDRHFDEKALNGLPEGPVESSDSSEVSPGAASKAH